MCTVATKVCKTLWEPSKWKTQSYYKLNGRWDISNNPVIASWRLKCILMAQLLKGWPQIRDDIHYNLEIISTEYCEYFPSSTSTSDIIRSCLHRKFSSLFQNNLSCSTDPVLGSLRWPGLFLLNL